MATHPGAKVTGPGVQQRYGITGRTLNRWKHDPSLGFPEPITINGRDYYEESALEAWERQRAAASRKVPKRSPDPEPEKNAA